LILVTPLVGYFLYHHRTMTAQVQRLGDAATPEEIAAAFKQRVYFVQAGVNASLGVMIANQGSHELIVTSRHVLIPGFDAGKANRAGRPLILQEVKARTPRGTAPKSCRVAAFH